MKLRALGVALIGFIACNPPEGREPKTPNDAHTTSAPRVPAGLRFVPQLGHTTTIESVALSSDGSLAVTGSSDESLKIWDLRAGRLVRTIAVSGSKLNAVAMAGEGALVVSGGIDDQTILHELELKEGANARKIHSAEHFSLTVWDVATGKSSKRLECHSSDVRGVATSKDAGVIASVGADAKLCIFKKLGAATPIDVPSPNAIAMSADGKHIGVASEDKHVRIFNADGKPEQDLATSGPALAIAFSPDGARVVVGARDGNVRIFDVGNGAVSQEFAAHKGAVRGVAFTSAGVVSVGEDEQARVWDRTGKAASTLGKHEGALRAAAGAGDWVAVAGTEGALRVYAASTGQRAWSFERNDTRPRQLAFAPDGKRLLVSGPDTLEVWDVNTLHRPKVLEDAHASGVIAAAPLGKDARDIVVLGPMGFATWNTDTGVARAPQNAKSAERGTGTWSSRDGSLVLVATGTTSQLVSANGRTELKTGPVTSASFSPDGRLVLVGGADGKVRIFTGDGTLAQTFDLDPFMQIYAVAMTPEKRIFAFASGAIDSAIGIWNLEQKTFRALRNVSREATTAAFTPNGKQLWVGNTDGTIMIWDTSMTSIVRRFDAHQGAIRAIAFDPDMMAATAGDDGVVRLWRNKDMITLVERNDDWLVFAEDGIFDASRTGADLVAIVDRTTVYAIDQFALRTNRPDILLQRMGLGTVDMRGYLAARADKRLKKAGLTGGSSLDFSVPVAHVTSVAADGKNAKVRFGCKAAPGRRLKSIRVAANNVLVFEKPVSGGSVDVDEVVELTEGPNEIDMSCVDTNGLESFRVKRSVTYGVETRGSLYYVGFGVSKYKESRLDLAFAHKDAQDLGKSFDRMKGIFDKVESKIFVNEAVDPAAFDKAHELLAKAKADDTIVVFVAGHGIHARDKEATYYYVVHASDPRNLAQTGVPFERLEGLFDGITARRRLLLLDTCESGDVDDFPGEQDASNKLRARSRSARGLVLEENATEAPKPTANPTAVPGRRRDYLRQRDRLIYDDLAMRTGAIVLASSQGSESSYESDEIQNGFFTRALLDSFGASQYDLDHDGWLEAHELRASVAVSVGKRSGGRQNPTIDKDNRLQKVHLPLHN